MKKNNQNIHPLKKYLLKNEITITDFANELGITIPYLFHILSYRKFPSRKLVFKICKKTKLPAEDLIFPPIETNK